jgi:hypothetical protein
MKEQKMAFTLQRVFRNGDQMDREDFFRALGRWGLTAVLAALGFSLLGEGSSRCPENTPCARCAERKRCTLEARRKEGSP